MSKGADDADGPLRRGQRRARRAAATRPPGDTPSLRRGGRLLDALSPRPLGASFRWLLASAWSTNLGDGIALAAGPLLVASQTDDPLLVAMAALLQRAPWLVFGLYAGVVADRLDRRAVVVAVNVLRSAVLAALSLMIVTDTVDVAVVLVTMFVLGTAETFADTTTSTLLPMLVPKAGLGVANSRLVAGHITANQLVGPPIGAALFAAGAAYPFATQAAALALGAVLVSRIASDRLAPTTAPTRAGAQIVEGFRWLWSHPPVRTLTVTIVAFNVTFGAAWSVLVLYATERLGLGAVGFGLLTATSAVGGVLGSALYARIERRFSLADVMRVGLVIETLTHLALALTDVPAVAGSILFVFGIHAAVWGTTATSIRHRAVPSEFQGRVASVYMIGVHGGIVAGAAIGGAIARVGGVTAPFWFAFVGSAAILVAIRRELAHIAHAGE